MNNREEDQQALVVNVPKSPSHKSSKQDLPLDDNLSKDLDNHQEEHKEPQDDGGDLIEEAQQRLTDVDKKAQVELNKLEEKLGFQGSPVQIAQQNSLATLAAQIIASTFLALLISQIDPLQWLWELIPLLDYISIILFVTCLVLVQFFRQILVKPFNFLFFLIHTISKVFLLTYFSVWFEDYRMEVFFVDVIFLIGYMLFNIYTASQAGEQADVSIRGNFWKLILYSLLVSLFLVLFTRSSIWVWLMLNVFSLIYAFFLLLSMQRFPEHTYLQEKPNDFYLGAAQYDADLFLPCSFIRYLVNGLKHEDGIDIK